MPIIFPEDTSYLGTTVDEEDMDNEYSYELNAAGKAYGNAHVEEAQALALISIAKSLEAMTAEIGAIKRILDKG